MNLLRAILSSLVPSIFGGGLGRRYKIPHEVINRITELVRKMEGITETQEKVISEYLFRDPLSALALSLNPAVFGPLLEYLTRGVFSPESVLRAIAFNDDNYEPILRLIGFEKGEENRRKGGRGSGLPEILLGRLPNGSGTIKS